jgi:flagellar motor switch protein FliM
VDIARGVRQGEIKLILPSLRSRESLHPQPATDKTEHEGTRKADLTKQVMGLNADLRMIVCTLSVPLNKLRALKVGDDLALPPGAFPNVQITTTTGRILGRGVVGHVDGVRAVKPSRPPLHAERPLRRESDQPDVDLPEVEVLTSSGRSMTVSRAVDVSDAELEAAMQTLSAADVNMDTTEIPDMSVKLENMADANGPEHVTTLAELPELEDLPDLDDLPDLADLAMQSVG